MNTIDLCKRFLEKSIQEHSEKLKKGEISDFEEGISIGIRVGYQTILTEFLPLIEQEVKNDF